MEIDESKRYSFEQYRSRLVAVFGLADDATVADFEICLRKLSSYEKGVILARALDEGYFPSLRSMGEALGGWFTLNRFARVVALGRLPSAVVAAFERPDSMRQEWAWRLSTVLAARAAEVLQVAESIKQERAAGQEWPAKRVYEALIGKDES